MSFLDVSSFSFLKINEIVYCKFICTKTTLANRVTTFDKLLIWYPRTKAIIIISLNVLEIKFP